MANTAYIGITIHELAHLGVGIWRGMKPGALVIGGFRLIRSGDRWTFRAEWRHFIVGGMFLPMSTSETTIADFVLTIAAGPAASVLWTIVCWEAFQRFGSGVENWIGSLFWSSLLGWFSMIPMSNGVNMSDAARVVQLLRRPDQGRAWMAMVAIQAENVRGVRPRDLDAMFMARMLSAPQPGAGRIGADLMAYQRSLEEGDDLSACLHLEAALRPL